MIVVSDTSPLTNLAAIGQFSLLASMFSEVHVAHAVCRELTADGNAWPGAEEVKRSPYIHCHSVQNRLLVQALEIKLDQGEAESIVLALESDIKLILMDEKEGRSAARQMGLKPIGVIGILIQSKRKGHIPSIGAALSDLRHSAGFYIHDELFNYALRVAEEDSP